MVLGTKHFLPAALVIITNIIKKEPKEQEAPPAVTVAIRMTCYKWSYHLPFVHICQFVIDQLTAVTSSHE